MSAQGRRLDQSKAHFYYQCRKVGITRDQLGVTAHGLRHQYAARRYAQLAGMSPPVAHNAPGRVTEQVREADRAAREQISRELGHFRADITQAYTGSLSMITRSPDIDGAASDLGELRSPTISTYSWFHDKDWLDRDMAVALMTLLERWSAGANNAFGNGLSERKRTSNSRKPWRPQGLLPHGWADALQWDSLLNPPRNFACLFRLQSAPR